MQSKNRGVPKKIDSHLVTFDCITCDKCIPVCPNDANFTYHSGLVEFTYQDVEVQPDGTFKPVGTEQVFKLEQSEQIANFADYCNHCGNCDTFCPEYDGPYLKKPSFFGSRAAFDAGEPHDGFLLEGELGSLELTSRIDGAVNCLRETHTGHQFDDGDIVIEVEGDGALRLVSEITAPHHVNLGRFHALRTLLAGISNGKRIHGINTRLHTSDSH